MRWEAYDEIEGCGVLHYKRHEDERGFFQELINHAEIAKAGIPLLKPWVQENTSFSHAGVIRGFHVQRNNPQGKLVTCLAGRIMDVCLDVRRDSPTFLRMTRVILDGREAKSFWLPPGTAHAFIALSEALIHYRCTTAYDRNSDGGVNATSPEVAMVWPPGEWMRSEKDRGLPNLVDYLEAFA